MEKYKEILSKLNKIKPVTFKWHDTFIDFENKLCTEKNKLTEAGFMVDLQINNEIININEIESCGTETNPKEYIYLCVNHPALQRYASILIGLCQRSQLYPAIFVRLYNRFVKSEYYYSANYKLDKSGKWHILNKNDIIMPYVDTDYIDSAGLVTALFWMLLHDTQ